jgi:hypothetical protein
VTTAASPPHPLLEAARVVFHEPSMALGVALYAAAALDFLGGE